MSLPLVSIGVPFYNSSSNIERVIKNLLEQSFENIEIILSDNCSTDNSKEIIDKFLINKKIIFFKNDKNRGAIFNHNVLIDYAKGKYFMWAHCDDLISKNFVKDAVTFLERDSGISSVTGKMIFIEKNVIKKQLDEPKILNGEKFERIKNFIINSFSDSLIMGLHRKSILIKKKIYIIS